MSELNLVEILRFAPEGLELYDCGIHDTVAFQYIKSGSSEKFPIVCYQCPDSIKLPSFYSKEGYSSFAESLQIFKPMLKPDNKHDWDDWQWILFPKSINSYITDGTNIFQIASRLRLRNIYANDLIPFGMVDLSKFSYTSVISVKQPEKISETIIAVDEELGLKPFCKVLVKNSNENTANCFNVWTPKTYECVVNTPFKKYYMADSILWEECIPYNKHTIHLIGTSDPFDISTIKNKNKTKKNK